MGHGHHPNLPPPVYPSMPPVRTEDAEPEFSPEYMQRLTRLMERSMEAKALHDVDRNNRVDEFRPQTLQGESLSLQLGQPDYECQEIIERIIITGPTGASQQTQQTTIVGTQPPAGSNFTWTNNTGVAQELIAVQAFFTADANAANRFLKVAILDANGHVIAYTQDATAVVASTTITINAYQGGTLENAASGTFNGVLPQNLFVPAGGSVQINAANIDSGDQFSNIYLVFAGTTPNSTGTPFTLQLGRRVWNLALPPTGVLTISSALVLERSDVRQLTASTPGDWSFELMGYALVGRTGRV
jgi:hypothetical protein